MVQRMFGHPEYTLVPDLSRANQETTKPPTSRKEPGPKPTQDRRPAPSPSRKKNPSVPRSIQPSPVPTRPDLANRTSLGALQPGLAAGDLSLPALGAWIREHSGPPKTPSPPEPAPLQQTAPPGHDPASTPNNPGVTASPRAPLQSGVSQDNILKDVGSLLGAISEMVACIREPCPRSPRAPNVPGCPLQEPVSTLTRDGPPDLNHPKGAPAHVSGRGSLSVRETPTVLDEKPPNPSCRICRNTHFAAWTTCPLLRAIQQKKARLPRYLCRLCLGNKLSPNGDCLRGDQCWMFQSTDKRWYTLLCVEHPQTHFRTCTRCPTRPEHSPKPLREQRVSSYKPPL